MRLIDHLTYLGRDLNREEYQFSTPDSLNAFLDKYRLTGALVCAYRDGVLRAPEWRICRSPEGSMEYARGRATDLGVVKG